MRKYWAFFHIKFQNFTSYRGIMLLMIFANTITVITLLSVAFAAPEKFANFSYDRSKLISYYIAGLFLQWATLWYPFYALQRDIKNGSIVGQILVKPVSLFWSNFFQELSWHSISSVLGLLTAFIIGFFLIHSFKITTDFSTLTLFVASGAMAAFLVFSISICMGLLAFWLTHISVLDSIFWATRAFLAGQVVPIVFFPTWARGMLTYLPFRYTFSFPLEILLGQLNIWQIVQGFLISVFWIGIFVAIYKIFLPRGIKAYSAFGN